MTDIVVSIKQGAIRGAQEQTSDGTAFYSFKGIPYAKPPVGNLRFKAPEPAEPWKGIRDATQHQNKAAQIDMIFSTDLTVIGSEDCLYINVYTLEDPRETNGKVKPVMVWIHGGAFLAGSGHSEEYGPDNFIKEDVVVVTFNYRLGAFGFLSVDDPEAGIPGNAALKDMVLALKWVKENISKFSGDSNNITIFGESAGAASVHYLTISPMAKGLFNQAIIQSGSVLTNWALMSPDVNPLKELSKLLNISETEDLKILKELETFSAQEIIAAQLKLSVPGSPAFFAPTIEKPSKEPAFLSEHPLKIIKSGRFNQVPTIFGYTSREGLLMSKTIEFLVQNFDHLVSKNLNLPKGSPKEVEITEKIKQFYFGGEEPTMDDLDQFYLLLSDIYFCYSIIAAAKEYAEVSSENVYFYRFSLDGSHNFFKKFLNIQLPGACHADELAYQFKIDKIKREVIPDSAEDLTVKRLAQLWTNFAKYSDPNSKEDKDLINIEWKPIRKDEFNFLEIGENLTVGLNPDWKRFELWEEIMKILVS